ncbi:MAG: biotin--[acetyl-CoA-carboxylase] ligase [Erythrobacter sp.]
MINTVEETGSTNADLAAILRSGETIAEGEWLVAKRQVSGRGRQGRKWEDGEGNFMGSTVVHLDEKDRINGAINLPVSLALHGAVAEFLAQPSELMLKWPNDLLLSGAKLSGVLMELVGNDVIVGIGVNLAVAPELDDRETIALSQIGPAPTRSAFAERLAECLANELINWRDRGEAPMRDRWLALAHPTGTHLTVHDVDGSKVEGLFEGLEPGGALLLRLADGESRAIHAGDVLID